MTELKFFRLMLVFVATLVLSLGSGWAYYTHRQHITEAAIDSAFGEYNRYIAACGDNKEGGAWDLAQRAYDSVSKLSAARDVYAGRAELPLWIGAIVCPALVALFYALRWAMTGRVRPLWLLGRRSTAG